MQEQISKEKLVEINKEIEAVLIKYGVTLQPTLGISIVPVAPKENETTQTPE
jgi:hypothetical protein